MALTSRVYSAPVTGKLVSFQRVEVGGSTKSASKSGKRTFWQWLANVFGAKDEPECSCTASRAEAEAECNRRSGLFNYKGCVEDPNGNCWVDYTCTNMLGETP